MRFMLFAVAFVFVAVAAEAQTRSRGKLSTRPPSVSYDGTKESLQKIIDAYEPLAQKGDTVAVFVCREAHFALQPVEDVSSVPRSLAQSNVTQKDPLLADVVKKAKAGDVLFQKVLAFFYEEGIGVRHDAKLATEWYMKSAEGGYARSQMFLAKRYYRGKGMEKDDDAKCLEWMQKAADSGDAYGQYELGMLYWWGKVVPKDIKTWKEWTLKSAEQGYSLAQSVLGCEYYYGKEIPRDWDAAEMWFKRAFADGDPDGSSAGFLGRIYEARQDYVQAAEWFRKGQERGDSHCSKGYASLLERGLGVNRDPLEAEKLYKKAMSVDLGRQCLDPTAIVSLADLYARESAEGHTWAKAAELYREAVVSGMAVERGMTGLRTGVDEGRPDAQFHLGELYFKGAGDACPKDIVRGMVLTCMAAKQGHRKAAESLKTMDLSLSSEERKSVNEQLKAKGVDLNELVSAQGGSVEPKDSQPEPIREMRKWTSASGSTLEARLVSVKNGRVLLEKEAGGKTVIRVRSLIQADQEYLRSVNAIPASRDRP